MDCRDQCTTKIFSDHGRLVGLAGTMDLIGISSDRLFQPASVSMLGPRFIGVAVSFWPG